MRVKLFPRKDGSTASCKINVDCGEWAKITAVGLCPGMSMCFSEVFEDKCRCERHETLYCVAGSTPGVNGDDPCGNRAAIPTPGCFIGYLCVQEGVEVPEDYAIYAEICDGTDNLSVITRAACAAG